MPEQPASKRSLYAPEAAGTNGEHGFASLELNRRKRQPRLFPQDRRLDRQGIEPSPAAYELRKSLFSGARTPTLPSRPAYLVRGGTGVSPRAARFGPHNTGRLISRSLSRPRPARGRPESRPQVGTAMEHAVDRTVVVEFAGQRPCPPLSSMSCCANRARTSCMNFRIEHNSTKRRKIIRACSASSSFTASRRSLTS